MQYIEEQRETGSGNKEEKVGEQSFDHEDFFMVRTNKYATTDELITNYRTGSRHRSASLVDDRPSVEEFRGYQEGGNNKSDKNSGDTQPKLPNRRLTDINALLNKKDNYFQ